MGYFLSRLKLRSAFMTIGEKLAIIAVIAAAENPDLAKYTQDAIPPMPKKMVKTCPKIGINRLAKESLFFVLTSA
jgi:hypothetical protein